MDSIQQSAKALCLLSGGLDSQLAVCVLLGQGVRVEGVSFESPFFGPAAAQKAAQYLGIPLHVVDFSSSIIGLLGGPPHGFGSGMNPCIDCHARMLRVAGGMMEGLGARFLATGEVLDERPMSQTRRSLAVVASESGYGDVVLRPLSAKLLPETLPEREGWVDRQRLLSLRGRGRREQMALAGQYGIVDYPTPAGGCLLTDPAFSHRLRDLSTHEGLGEVRAIRRLRVGRHFRFASGLKFIVGRNQADNEWIDADAQPGEYLLRVHDIPGPTALISASADEAALRTVAAVCARYSDSPAGRRVAVELRAMGGASRMLEVEGADSKALGLAMV